MLISKACGNNVSNLELNVLNLLINVITHFCKNIFHSLQIERSLNIDIANCVQRYRKTLTFTTIMFTHIIMLNIMNCHIWVIEISLNLLFLLQIFILLTWTRQFCSNSSISKVWVHIKKTQQIDCLGILEYWKVFFLYFTQTVSSLCRHFFLQRIHF